MGGASRRAPAQIHGLLTIASNRKIAIRSRSPIGKMRVGPEGTAVMIRHLIAPLAVAVVTFHAGQVLAQGAFPAPLPGRAGTVNDPAFPPVNGAAPTQSFGNSPAPAAFPGTGSAQRPGSPFAAPPTDSGAIDGCMKEFLPIRAEAEKRGKLLKV